MRVCIVCPLEILRTRRACSWILFQLSPHMSFSIMRVKKEGIDFAREYKCLFLKCSAKTRVIFEQCFEELVLRVITKRKQLEGEEDNYEAASASSSSRDISEPTMTLSK